MTRDQIQKGMEGQFVLATFINNLATEEERIFNIVPISNVNIGKLNILNDIIESLEGYTSIRSNFNRERFPEK